MVDFTKNEVLAIMRLHRKRRNDLSVDELALAYITGRDNNHYLGGFGDPPDDRIFYACQHNIDKYLEEKGEQARQHLREAIWYLNGGGHQDDSAMVDRIEEMVDSYRSARIHHGGNQQ